VLTRIAASQGANVSVAQVDAIPTKHVVRSHPMAFHLRDPAFVADGDRGRHICHGSARAFNQRRS
jgi:hypothetical protein